MNGNSQIWSSHHVCIILVIILLKLLWLRLDEGTLVETEVKIM